MKKLLGTAYVTTLLNGWNVLKVVAQVVVYYFKDMGE